jgi:hypothetical protein
MPRSDQMAALVPDIEEEDARLVGLGAFFEFLCIVRRCNASFDGGGRHGRIEANEADDMLDPTHHPKQRALLADLCINLAACFGHRGM